MIHAQFTRHDQIDKYVEYKIRPSFYTLHTYYFAEAHIANRGPEQAAYISPMRDAIDAGLHPTNHTDFVVAPLDQMFMLWSAVNRISRDGDVIGPDQRITPLEGLKTMTIWAAEQYGEADSKGSLAPGKLRRPRDPRRRPADGRADGDQGHRRRRDDQGRGARSFRQATRERCLRRLSTIAGVGTRLSARWNPRGPGAELGRLQN